MKHNTRLMTLAISAFLTTQIWAQDAPSFSHSHGFYTQSFALTISPSTEGGEIYYTLDCSDPTTKSTRYSGPITIKTTTVVRATERVTPDSLSAITTATYIFANDVLRQGNDNQGNPIAPAGYPSTWGPYASIAGTAPGYYAMDSHIVNESKDHILKGLQQLPVVSMVTDRNNLFSKDIDEETGGIYIYTGAPTGSGLGRDWERRISLEVIGGPLELDYTSDCGTKIHGGHSRLAEKNPKHAFRLMFKGKYGAKKMKYAVFGKGEGMVKKFEDLVLRTYFGNAWTHWDEGNRTKAQYTRDLWARSIQERLGMPASHGQPVHLFLNGMYWGIYNLCERLNSDHFAQHFGGEPEDYDVIKVDENAGEAVVADDGTLDQWNRMVSMARNVSLLNNATLYRLEGRDAQGARDESIEPLLDIDNFIDYMLINFYAGNTDWDHHNWIAYRRAVNPEYGFRFICWDSELIFGSVDENVVTKNNAGKPTGILRSLMYSREFASRFNHRAHLLFDAGGRLSPEGAIEVFDSLYHQIDEAIYAESARWGDYRRDIHKYQSAGHRYRVDSYYMNERNRLLNDYFPVRTKRVISQLRSAGWWKDADNYADLNPIELTSAPSSVIYDLQGRPVTEMQPGKTYIRDGKKVRF